MTFFSSLGTVVNAGKEKKEKVTSYGKRPRRDLNPQSSDPKSDALSIRPRGLIWESCSNLS